LVVMVIFVFLRSASATLIPAVVVPLSLVGTFAVMYLAGFSVNNLTLMALTVATGFVVDDAIVMIENIARFLQDPDKPRSPVQAAIEGAQQIGFTIVSLTFSLLAVLIPLLFMGDVVGRLFHEFAITLAVAILISAFVSLTLTPMLCAHVLQTQKNDQDTLDSGAWLKHLIAVYGRGLNWVLDRPVVTLVSFGLTVVLTVAAYLISPKGFFPLQDTGAVQVITEATQSTSFAAMSERQQALAVVLLKDPAVQSLSSFIGVDGPNTTLNTGRMTLNLVPKSQRDAPLADILQRLSQSADGISGMRIYLQPLQDLSLEDRVARTQYRFLLSGPDNEALGLWSQRLLAQLRQHPSLAEVASDFQDQGLQAYVRIDRDAASRLGVSVAAIDNALYNAFGQRLVSTIFTQSNQYRVVLEVNAKERMGPQALARLTVPSVSGVQVPLGSVATLEERAALLSQVHVNQFPAVTLSFQPSQDASLGEAVAAIDQIWQQMREQDKVPNSIESRFEGAALAFQASLTHSLWLVLAAVVTMYIVLGVLYESYIHPVTILSTLPSAALGALLALWLARLDISLIAVIGIILLIGIVKKNAIMMIDFALDAERRQGLSPRQAIEQACLLRFRPILMTTLCALLGALPLMLGTGVGSELRHPLGVTLVGGLILSQWLTLFTTPVIYLMLERLVSKRSAIDTP